MSKVVSFKTGDKVGVITDTQEMKIGTLEHIVDISMDNPPLVTVRLDEDGTLLKSELDKLVTLPQCFEPKEKPVKPEPAESKTNKRIVFPDDLEATITVKELRDLSTKIGAELIADTADNDMKLVMMFTVFLGIFGKDLEQAIFGK